MRSRAIIQGKRAEGHRILEFLPRIIFLTVAVLIIGIYSSFFLIRHVDTFEVEEETLLNRIYFSPELAAYQDPATGRAYPGQVDPEHIRTDHLERGLEYEDKEHIALKVVLEDRNGISVMLPDGDLAIGFVNQESYERWQPMTNIGLKGAGAFSYFERRLPVQYSYEDEIRTGFLKVSIIKPN